MTADLRLGRWQDVLEGLVVDTLIDDAPYGARTHEGHDGANEAAAANGMFPNKISYSHWTAAHVTAYVRSWLGHVLDEAKYPGVQASPSRVRSWSVHMTSHDLVPAWETSLAAAGRYAFAPLPYLDHGKSPRVLGDGPASWTVQIVVSRPRDGEWLAQWRRDRKAAGLKCSLPGAYVRSPGDTVWTPPKGLGKKRMGAKPLGIMRAIVRDYSRPGDLVCDTHAGHGTALLAALTEGREAVGAEVDPEAHAAACARLACGYTPDLFARASS